MLSVSGETHAGLILCRAGEVEESDILVSGKWCAGPISGQTCSAMRPWALQETFWSWSYLPQVPA